jgi:hypothetical protein
VDDFRECYACRRPHSAHSLVRAPEPIRGREVSACLACIFGWLRKRNPDATLRERLGMIYARFVIATITGGHKPAVKGDFTGIGVAIAAMQNEQLRQAIVAAAQAVRDEN